MIVPSTVIVDIVTVADVVGVLVEDADADSDADADADAHACPVDDEHDGAAPLSDREVHVRCEVELRCKAAEPPLRLGTLVIDERRGNLRTGRWAGASEARHRGSMGRRGPRA